MQSFDKIAHEPLIEKLNTFPRLEKLIRGWLKAGIVDAGQICYPEAGTPQGGVVTPPTMLQKEC